VPFSDLRNLSSSALRGYAKYHRRSSKALHSSITELDCYSAEASLSFSVPTAVIVEHWLRKVYKCQNLCEFQCLVGPLFRSSLATACRLHDLPLVLYHESRPTNDLAYPPSSTPCAFFTAVCRGRDYNWLHNAMPFHGRPSDACEPCRKGRLKVRSTNPYLHFCLRSTPNAFCTAV
jgi:hypothetical protein